MAATVAAAKDVSAFPARFLLTGQAHQQHKLAGVNRCEVLSGMLKLLNNLGPRGNY